MADCQKCGGEIQGWICQGCGQGFRENDAGVLVFAPMEAVAWRWEQWSSLVGAWAPRLTFDKPDDAKRVQALAVILTPASRTTPPSA